MKLNNKKILSILFIIVVILSILIVVIYINISKVSDENVGKIVHNEIEPVKKRLKIFKDIKKVRWKANTIGNSGFGPSSYYMKGYIILEESEFLTYLNTYEWDEKKNFKPDIEENFDFIKEESKWYYSSEIAKKLTKGSQSVSVYIDKINKIVYFKYNKN